MTTVRKLINDKPEAKIYTVPSTGTVLDALKVMEEGNTGAVLVTEADKIVGIFTERDYARQGEVKGRAAKSTPIKEVMTGEMVLIKPETTVNQCEELMEKFHVRHLPVLENDRVIGIISLRRLAKALLEEHKGTIVQLENYIQGTGYGH